MRKLLIITLVLGLAISIGAQEKTLELYISEAQALQKDGKLQEGVDLLKEAVQAFPQESNSYLQLGLAWGQVGQQAGNSGDFQNAMMSINEGFGAFEKATELDPKNFDAHFYYGMYGVNVPVFFGKLEPGVQHLEIALALLKGKDMVTSKDQLASVYRYLGQGYQMLERFGDSGTAWKKVLELSPEGEMALMAKGALKELESRKSTAQAEKVEKKKESKTVSALKVKLEKSPDNVDLYYQLGEAYYQEKDWMGARKALGKAMKLDPKNGKAQYLLAMTVMQDAQLEYDKRVYTDTDTRTNLAFESVRELEKTIELDPSNIEAKMIYAVGCIQMPFFVNRVDQGLAILEEMSADPTLPDSVRAEAMYMMGFGFRKKGAALWMKLLKKYPKSDQVESIYDEFGLREIINDIPAKKGEKVLVSFHLGFLDELAPQTSVWIEDKDGKYVKTLYVSGFSAFAKEKQINLPDWSKSSEFETDGTTGASIDWGKHTYGWDLTDQRGKRVKNGIYKVHVESSWWPSMQYGRASAEIKIGGASSKTTVEKDKFIPRLQVQYIKMGK